jgi:hypothetical protein
MIFFLLCLCTSYAHSGTHVYIQKSHPTYEAGSLYQNGQHYLSFVKHTVPPCNLLCRYNVTNTTKTFSAQPAIEDRIVRLQHANTQYAVPSPIIIASHNNERYQLQDFTVQTLQDLRLSTTIRCPHPIQQHAELNVTWTTEHQDSIDNITIINDRHKTLANFGSYDLSDMKYIRNESSQETSYTHTICSQRKSLIERLIAWWGLKYIFDKATSVKKILAQYGYNFQESTNASTPTYILYSFAARSPLWHKLLFWRKQTSAALWQPVRDSDIAQSGVPGPLIKVQTPDKSGSQNVEETILQWTLMQPQHDNTLWLTDMNNRKYYVHLSYSNGRIDQTHYTLCDSNFETILHFANGKTTSTLVS